MPSFVRWTMAPSHIFSLHLLLISKYYIKQDALLATKQAHLDEIVGQLREKEEEPEGEVLGDSDTGSLSYSFLLPNNLLIQFTLVVGCIALIIFFLYSLSDDSEREEEKGRPYTQEEEDVDIIRSWVKVGGHPAHQEEEAKELLTEVKHIPMSLSPFLFLFTCLLPISLTIFDVSVCYVLFPPSLQG